MKIGYNLVSLVDVKRRIAMPSIYFLGMSEEMNDADKFGLKFHILLRAIARLNKQKGISSHATYGGLVADLFTTRDIEDENRLTLAITVDLDRNNNIGDIECLLDEQFKEVDWLLEELFVSALQNLIDSSGQGLDFFQKHLLGIIMVDKDNLTVKYEKGPIDVADNSRWYGA